MPKIRLLNLSDEWTYGWRAHRQGHADKFILRSFIKLQVVLAILVVCRLVQESRDPLTLL